MRRLHQQALSPKSVGALTLLLALSATESSASATPPSGDNPPNVLIIVADDVGVDLIGAYEGDFPSFPADTQTPNIDLLASQGLRFRNCWTNPLCSPTRSQIMTGKHTQNTGVGIVLDPTDPTDPGLQLSEEILPEMLYAAMYGNAAVGKWHLGDATQGIYHPNQSGFFYYAGSLFNLGNGGYCNWEKTTAPCIVGNPCPQFQSTDYPTTDTTAEAIGRITSGFLQEPWFMYVAYNACHAIFHCPDDAESGVCPDLHTGRNWCRDCVGEVDDPLDPKPCPGDGPASPKAHMVRAMLEVMDRDIGDLVLQVDSSFPNTIVIFIGDNGTTKAGTLPPFKRLHSKATMYQGGVNVPLIVRGPGVVQDAVCDALVGSTDIFETVAEIAGVTPTADPLRESFSMVPYFSTPAQASIRDTVFAELFAPNFVPDAQGNPPPGYTGQFHKRALRNTDGFKLILREGVDDMGNPLGPAIEFFDLTGISTGTPDPFEGNDLYPSIVGGTSTPLQRSNYAALLSEMNTAYPAL